MQQILLALLWEILRPWLGRDKVVYYSVIAEAGYFENRVALEEEA